mmetsp:Transcript_38848/g.97888  ORF Transcript_38848/g.97888 Transcript_38848/m.97888 type:complete len:426 (+) Transcript_38848:1750-3027(+)
MKAARPAIEGGPSRSLTEGGASRCSMRGGASSWSMRGGASNWLIEGGASRSLSAGGASRLPIIGGAKRLANTAGGGSRPANEGGASRPANEGGASRPLSEGGASRPLSEGGAVSRTEPGFERAVSLPVSRFSTPSSAALSCASSLRMSTLLSFLLCCSRTCFLGLGESRPVIIDSRRSSSASTPWFTGAACSGSIGVRPANMSSSEFDTRSASASSLINECTAGTGEATTTGGGASTTGGGSSSAGGAGSSKAGGGSRTGGGSKTGGGATAGPSSSSSELFFSAFRISHMSRGNQPSRPSSIEPRKFPVLSSTAITSIISPSRKVSVPSGASSLLSVAKTMNGMSGRLKKESAMTSPTERAELWTRAEAEATADAEGFTENDAAEDMEAGEASGGIWSFPPRRSEKSTSGSAPVPRAAELLPPSN